jgi:outer membrane protein OmpA-like peptidoglycan-associated protein
MIHFKNNHSKTVFLLFGLLISCTAIFAQTEKRVEPKWWFGYSVAANINQYNGTTQMLNAATTVPTAFHKGKSVRPYASFLLEYRPNKVVGFMMNLAYDNRSAKFNQVMAPCNCPADLSTNLSYFSIEPSLRIAPFASAFYLFAGPTIGININKDFVYVQDKQVDQRGDFSDIRKTMLSAQAGAGIDIPLSKKSNTSQVTLSPFASFQTNLFQAPRTVETWDMYTIRAGLALKFGKVATAAPLKQTPAAPIETVRVVTVKEPNLAFSVRAPKIVPAERQVKEIFPLRNSVFFNMGSSDIPSRYVQLGKNESTNFKEAELQEQQPANLNNGRAARQLNVYYNILNIMGDRMRNNPNSSILLTGASDKNPTEGRLMAENIKQYLVNNYDIDPSRITTDGRDKPVIPSEQPGGTKQLDLLREGDRRVDITSTSSAMLLEVGGETSPFLKPVQIKTYQEDPLDTHVIFTNKGATELLNSWRVELKDEAGVVQNYGPYYLDQSSVSGKSILGNNASKNYQVTMFGTTKSGEIIQKESSVSVAKSESLKQEGLRYSILFDFDKSDAIAAYEKFLTDVVAPLIQDNGTAIIHGQ